MTNYIDKCRKYLHTKSLRAYGKTLPMRLRKFWGALKVSADFAFLEERLWVIVQTDDGETMTSLMTRGEMEEYFPEEMRTAIDLQFTEGVQVHADADDELDITITTDGSWATGKWDPILLKNGEEDVN